MTLWRGRPHPPGATYDGNGVNFSLFSEVSERVELCLFDGESKETRIDLPACTDHCRHGYIPGMVPGQRYGFRIHGAWDPKQGQRCNPAKLMLDPYAKAIDGSVQWDDALFPNDQDDRDSAAWLPRSVVVDTHFDWSDEHLPSIPWDETVIYELHVKGFTQRHPAIPEPLRGTYAGLGHPAAIEHLLSLGVTCVELLPIHQFVHDRRLVDMGLRNYWGYNSIGYFAPHNEYAATGQRGEQVTEFKAMVDALHQAGIEVLLDVVFNHTAEGNHDGPQLCFKGIDNAAYYRLDPDDRRHYLDFIGCGNALNIGHPRVLQLIMDCLRYWILEMHVDGFRFDAAAALARESDDCDFLSAFFDIIHQDPVISQTKLIAEPWDLGPDGYQVGRFPILWSEWNGKYRDSVRRYWRGDDGQLPEFARRVVGSGDLYRDSGRSPRAGINFVACHDGFTLHDLVSYSQRYNQANGEGNQDGLFDGISCNYGTEGPTDDGAVLALRERHMRNLLTTLFLSQGVPMLQAGDELGRSQQGNNNAYCQDNETGWLDWQGGSPEMLRFTRDLIAFRRDHAAFRRNEWFQGCPIGDEAPSDIAWYRPDGQAMTERDWQNQRVKALILLIPGQHVGADDRGRPLQDLDFCLLFNANAEERMFQLPRAFMERPWRCEIDTADDPPFSATGAVRPGKRIALKRQSLVLLSSVL